jgi:hypothetical protein
MKLADAKAIIGSIGFPSKMPGTSYGLPARACIAGMKLARVPGSVCSGCYAFRDQMAWPNSQKAQARRLAAISHPRWTEMMVFTLSRLHAEPTLKIDLGLRPGPKLTRLGTRYRINQMGFHRWHDSGDLQSIEHLEKIVEVCRATSAIRHWLPTREVAILREYLRRHGIGAIPDNLTIRVSATMIDGGAPASGLSLPMSAVHDKAPPPRGAHECPAPYQGHECKACRACWSRDVALVSYRKH